MTAELPSLAAVEQRAAAAGLLLRLQCRPLLALQPLRVVVALPRPGAPPLLLGELKGWAVPLPDGLQLDTMRVQGWPSATTTASTAAWCATSASWGLNRCGSWGPPPATCPCGWCGVAPAC
jgi:hypothetical protein